jgi:hypothetical protein
MNLREEYNKLLELKGNIESEAFQERIMQPLFKELEKQKNAYDCKTLGELSIVKGKKDGLKFIIGLLKQVEIDTKNKKNEIDDSE